jgi:hypothetical protein
MAYTNTLTAAIPTLVAQGLMALRENCVMPRLVNRNFENTATEKFATVNVPIPSAITSVAVSPSYVAPDDPGVMPTSVPITLDQWFEAPFFMSDKDLLESAKGVIPMQASEAIKSLANRIDAALLGLAVNVYGFVGTPGVTPFASDVSEITAARRVLNNQLAPLDDRRVVINADAEANALGLRAFQDMSFSGSSAGIIDGKINRKLGFDWYMDQNIPTYTTGTVAVSFINKSGTAVAAGLKTLVSTTGGTAALLKGDVFTIAGDTQTYVLTAAASRSGGGDMTILFEPALKIALTGSEVITLKASHAINLAFHRDCFAFVSRPLADNTDGLGNIIQSAIDPISGLSLRLEVSRQHRRTRFAYDVLYGMACVRPALGCRIAG